MKHPKQERTYVMVKPDGVKRGLVGEIVRRFEQRGLKIVAMKMFEATRDQIDGHYPKAESWITRVGTKTLDTYQHYGLDPVSEIGTANPLEIGNMVRGWLLEYMTEGPMVKMVVEGIHAIDMVRKICGHTLPNKAEMGTIRGDYSVDSPAAANKDKRGIHNLIHASETPEEASHEIDYWFAPEEIFTYKRAEEDIMF